MGFLGHARDGIDRVEETMLLGGISDIGFEKKTIHLGVDILNRDLEAVEGTRLRDLDLLHESSGEILQNDAVRGGEEGEDMGDEVLLIWDEIFPLALVLGKIHLLGGLERGFCFLVHFPDLWVFGWEHAESIWVRRQQGFFWECRHGGFVKKSLRQLGVSWNFGNWD